MHRTSALKRASADWWPNQYKRDEVVVTEVIQKRAHSNGNEDEVEICQILG